MDKRQLKEIVVQQREEIKKEGHGNRKRKSGRYRKIPENPTCIDNQRCEAVWKIDPADTDHVRMVESFYYFLGTPDCLM